MKLQCLLVDDEPPALEVLESYVREVAHLELVASCSNALQAFGVLQERSVDLLFLDIKMPKMLGTEFLRSLRHPPKVIFTTAYREYAYEGFELDAVDYLLKPVSLERFLKAVAKASKTETPAVAEPAQGVNSDAFLYFRIDRKMVKVMLRDILYVEGLKDYVMIHTVGGTPLIVKQTISGMEEKLSESNFLRIHRSFIVALDKIQSYSARHIEVAKEELPIGRLFQKRVEEVLG
ncbi:two component transcriptional regulator, LytTR family [Hymenobacter roseosalivarius DSM 11622]|uniref:Two component transcriptional regulator, LytTR family n=1 Tax=Hymenobacter roseosalivarius DSM 11622 TaxID=645990 RepID=A0A1W1W412_9BACT|nr:LytTR family DNA-binding domain-containing protein [Hymenobacter roseosalivarius]SMC00336.1 two component transcriptional regulator, LytTR family [Hymenobacter roseosalivarius DSM 11622]